MSTGYDKSLMNLCESKMRLLNNKGDVVNVDVYFENNRMRIDKTSDGEFMKFADSSYMIIIQNNDVTSLRCKSGKRLIIDGKPYEITGIDDHSTGLIYVGLNNSQINMNDDYDGVANYKSQMEEINGSLPPEPTNNIVGEDELYKDYPNEYYLMYTSSGVVWRVDCDYVVVNQDGTKCTLYYDTLSDANKTFTLSATYGGSTYTKTITTRKF